MSDFTPLRNVIADMDFVKELVNMDLNCQKREIQEIRDLEARTREANERDEDEA